MNPTTRTVFGLLAFVCVEMNDDQKAYLEMKLDQLFEADAKILDGGMKQ